MKSALQYEEKFISKRAQMPKIRPGMQVRVFQKIQEGKKERLQAFEGLVTQTKGNNELNFRITVRKIASGVGVEKVYPLHSPVIDHIEVVNQFKVRRANLRYVRTITKDDRLKEDRSGLEKTHKRIAEAEAKISAEAKKVEPATEAKKDATETK
jgi:large subunit ribosomal protein L19